MVRKVRVSLSSLLSDAQERGLVSRNVVRELRSRPRRREGQASERRQKGKLKVGVDIPTREEIKAIVEAAKGRWRPILLTAIFTGLRASELRGLRWADVDFDKRELHVRQRADRYSAIGKPKSESGERTVPLTPIVVNTLREWKLACPKSEAGLVFPSTGGLVEHHKNIVERGLVPTLIAAGVAIEEKWTGRRAGQARQIHRPSRPAALLRVMVHQPSRRWRPGAAGQGGAGAARPFVDHDDDGRLRALVPARRRFRRARGRGTLVACVSGPDVRGDELTRGGGSRYS